MRFLVGMVIGAAVVLMAVEAADGDSRWRQPLLAAADRAGAWLADLSAHSGGTPPAAPEPTSVAEPAAAPEPVAVTEPPVAREPLAAQAPPAAPSAPSAAPEEPVPAAVAAEPARQPIPRPPDPLPADGPERLAVDDAPAVPHPAVLAQHHGAEAAESPQRLDGGQQAVWVPFHSEMSARGFADRLSRSVHYPFEVQRRGPGRYQVVFGYADDPQRRALLQSAAEATGLPL